MIQDIFEPLIFVNKVTIPDGMGGTETIWKDGAEFQGSITLDNSIEAKVAEQQGVTNVYTVTTGNNVFLEFNDIIKRKEDQQTFKIKSLNNTENIPPEFAVLKLRYATAELHNLPPLKE